MVRYNIDSINDISTEYDVAESWQGSALKEETTLHQIAPYIGKIKSSMARAIIANFTCKNSTIYEPFCGSGSIPLEAWINGRNVIANDLNPYADVLTRAKLFPITNKDKAMVEIKAMAQEVSEVLPTVDVESVPQWVRSFFHPDTLREIVAWAEILRSRESYFLLACLLGILHHQRPGFLSYPSSHTAPYLRQKKFPPDKYPDLYEYRPVRERLEKKVARALERLPLLDPKVYRECQNKNAAEFTPRKRVDAIITSPPYMKQLDYGRDNRLRLWFIGAKDWKVIDDEVSPPEKMFFDLLRSCLRLWHKVLAPNGLCILVLGDTYARTYNSPLHEAVINIATKEVGGYSMVWKYTEIIPRNRRVRRACLGSTTETILVMRNIYV